MPSEPLRQQSRPPKTSDPLVGQLLDQRYRVERLIGRGGMGLVYLATDTRASRDVVVKMVAPHWVGDADAESRFEREGERLAELSHPNIVELFEVGSHEGQPYIVMEYIDGEPLKRYLGRKGALGLAEFVPIASQLLTAVGHAHAREMMVRDVKPANVMLHERDGKTNVVKLLDFGLAKLVEGDERQVTQAHVVGTSGYLAPELIKGDKCDVRVDVYALGIVFFEMLTGQTPIIGDNDAAVLYNHVHGTPIRLEALLPEDHGLPAELIALIERCMAKNPEERPGDGNEVAELLFECVAPELFTLPPATDQTRKELAEYRATIFEQPALDDDASSAEWTRPLAREAAVAANPSDERGSSEASDVVELDAEELEEIEGSLSGPSVVAANDDGSSQTDVEVEDPELASDTTIPSIRDHDASTPMLETVYLEDEDDERPRSSRSLTVGVFLAGVAALALGATAALMFLEDEAPTPVAQARVETIEAPTPMSAEPTPRTAPRTTGGLSLSVPAEAIVYIDGKEHGRGSLDADLEPGVHRVRVEAEGLRPWSSEVEIIRGQTSAIEVTLDAQASPVVSRKQIVDRAPTSKPRPKPSGETAAEYEPSRPEGEPTSAEPSPSRPKSDAKPEPKASKGDAAKASIPDDDVFMAPSEGKHDGIFLPVGKRK